MGASVFIRFGLVSILLVLDCSVRTEQKVHTEHELEVFLQGDFERQKSEDCRKVAVVHWAMQTDLTNAEKAQETTVRELESSELHKSFWEEYFRDACLENITNPYVKRQVMIQSELGVSALDEETQSKLSSNLNAMGSIYSTGKVCPFTNQQCDLNKEGMPLEPDLERVMAQSHDYDELAYVWTAWRKQTGAKIRHNYKVYVDINNQVAKQNDYGDMGEMWRSEYDSETFGQDMDNIWEQVKPLYVQLHTYVGRKLATRYGDRLRIDEDGLIPAHVFGNMWAQTWTNIYGLVRPYPDAHIVNITAALREKNYTVLQMFETANNFYTSLGMPNCSMSYDVTKGAILTRPSDKDMSCHASAWEFCDGKDYRIKMCAEVNGADFLTIYHEMGHIQYFIQYKDQPYTFRNGANTGFHEAVGDTIALSVTTPMHLQKIGLLTDYTDSRENSLNALMHTALDKVAFLPFGLLLDKWSWDVFSGSVSEEQWNSHWWALRARIQLVKPPVARTERDFDPGAKYHIAADSQYMPYFVAHILQFQLHKGLCIKAGQYNPEDTNETALPLHKCDIYGSKEAGSTFMRGLKLGASEHWSETLFRITGSRELDASALLEYFQPLRAYLEEENARECAQSKFVHILVASIVLFVICLIVIVLCVLARQKKNNAKSFDLAIAN